MSGLAYALAGAVGGLGQGLMKQAEDKREEAREKLRRQYQIDDRNQRRDWQLSDRADDRSYNEGRERSADAKKDARRKKYADVYRSLFGTESRNNFNAANDEGYIGRGQFGQARLNDFTRATGRAPMKVRYIKGNTPEKKELQKQIEQWHFADINKFIDKNDLMRFDGQTIKGVKITRSGMIAAAHLGGRTGMKRFLESGGKYDPADSNGTRLSAYARTHGGLSTDMDGVWDLIADEDAPAGLRKAALDKVSGGAIQEITGEEWVSQKDGTEVLMGRVGKTKKMVPYTDDNGKPISRPDSKNRTERKKTWSITSTDRKAIAGYIEDDDWEGDAPKAREMTARIEAIMREDASQSVESAYDIVKGLWVQGDAKTRLVDRRGLGWAAEKVFGGDGKKTHTAPGEWGWDDNRPSKPSKPAAKGGNETILKQARDAIKKGADRKAVEARLRENGIDPGLL